MYQRFKAFRRRSVVLTYIVRKKDQVKRDTRLRLRRMRQRLLRARQIKTYLRSHRAVDQFLPEIGEYKASFVINNFFQAWMSTKKGVPLIHISDSF